MVGAVQCPPPPHRPDALWFMVYLAIIALVGGGGVGGCVTLLIQISASFRQFSNSLYQYGLWCTFCFNWRENIKIFYVMKILVFYLKGWRLPWIFEVLHLRRNILKIWSKQFFSCKIFQCLGSYYWFIKKHGFSDVGPKAQRRILLEVCNLCTFITITHLPPPPPPPTYTTPWPYPV